MLVVIVAVAVPAVATCYVTAAAAVFQPHRQMLMAAKVPSCAALALDAVNKEGMCVVIGLQSTGEANTTAVSSSTLKTAHCRPQQPHPAPFFASNTYIHTYLYRHVRPMPVVVKDT